MSSSLFSQVDTEQKALGTRASWTGVISIDSKMLGVQSTYHVRSAVIKGSMELDKSAKIETIDSVTGKEVVSREVPCYYRYRRGQDSATGAEVRQDFQPVSYEEAKQRIRFKDENASEEWLVTARQEARYFIKEDLDGGKFVEVPQAQIQNRQGQEIVQLFEGTKEIQITDDDLLPLPRVQEYQVYGLRMLDADQDKKVRERKGRIRELALKMLEKNVAAVSFFAFSRGAKGTKKGYTSILFPFERKEDGKLWLVQLISEGFLAFDETWSLDEQLTTQQIAPVPLATGPKKPKVNIAK